VLVLAHTRDARALRTRLPLVRELSFEPRMREPLSARELSTRDLLIGRATIGEYRDIASQ
jgi:hypothetical protein